MPSVPADSDPFSRVHLQQARRKARWGWLIPLAALPLFNLTAPIIPGWILLLLIIATPIASADFAIKALILGRRLPERSLVVHGTIGLVACTAFTLLMILGLFATTFEGG